MKIKQRFPFLQYEGSSTFKFTFTIDYDFYDEGVGGSKSAFWFVLNCRTGAIVEFEDISEEEKHYIRIPYYGDVQSPWSIQSYEGEPFSLDMHGSDLQYYSADEVKNIAKTINSSNFRSVANAVLSKIRAHKGDSFIGEEPAEANYWAEPNRQNQIKVFTIVKNWWGAHDISPKDIDEISIEGREIETIGSQLFPFIENGSLFEALPNLNSFYCGVELTQLPETIFGAEKLQRLLITGNQLKLSKNIGQLPNLKHLYLSGTIELPDNVGEWTHLKTLHLGNWEGDVTSLPDSLANLCVKVFSGGFKDSIFSKFFQKSSKILNNIQPVQDARRGYIVPEDEQAEALMKKLKGREKLWSWLQEMSDYEANFHIADETILHLLQSQSKRRHLRGAWLTKFPYSWGPEFEVLSLNDGPCESLEFLENLGNLKVLNLDNTKIPDLSPLQHCPALKDLSLRGAVAEDFSVLGKLEKLERLVLEGVSQFKQADILSELKALKDLDL